MASNSTVTVTGKAGPGVTVTAQTFTGVDSFSIECENEILVINQGGTITKIAISSATTITCTVSGNTYTLTIS